MIHSFGRVLGVDLGTSKTCIARADQQVIFQDLSAVALLTEGDRCSIHRLGAEAQAMEGRERAGIAVRHPIVAGRIEDVVLAQRMLKAYLKRAEPHAHYFSSRLLAPDMLIAAPGCSSPAELRALEEVALEGGARRVAVVNEAVAAALGAGLDVHAPRAHLVIDIGAGTTEIAVLTMGEVVTCHSLRVAGRDFDVALRDHLARTRGLDISLREAERLKIDTASLDPQKGGTMGLARGRSLSSRLPVAVQVSASELSLALEPLVTRIAEALAATLRAVEPEALSDLMTRGAMLTGGGALLCGMGRALSDRCALPVILAEDPRGATIRGLARMLANRRQHAGFIRFSGQLSTRLH